MEARAGGVGFLSGLGAEIAGVRTTFFDGPIAPNPKAKRKNVDFSQYLIGLPTSVTQNEEPPVNFLYKTGEEQVFYDIFNQMQKISKKGDGVFRLLAHGNYGLIGNRTDEGEDRFLDTAEKFDALMTIKSPEYKAAIEGDKPFTFFLYVCWSGSSTLDGGDSIGLKLSKAHPKGTFITFDGTGHFDYVNGKLKFLGIGNNSKNHAINNNKGYMVIYHNKKEVSRQPSNDETKKYINSSLGL